MRNFTNHIQCFEGDTYWSANVGDSRLVVGYEDEKDVIFETLDHKPGVEEEKKRKFL